MFHTFYIVVIKMSASRSHSMQLCQPKLFYTISKIYSELIGKVF